MAERRWLRLAASVASQVPAILIPTGVGTRVGLLVTGGIAAVPIAWTPTHALLLLIALSPVDLAMTGGQATMALAALLPAIAITKGLLLRQSLNVRLIATCGAAAALIAASAMIAELEPLQLSRTRDVMTLTLGLGLLVAAALLRPEPDRLVMAITIQALMLAVLSNLTSRLGAQSHMQTGTTRLQAFGLNANYIGVVLAMGLVSGVALAARSSNPTVLVLCVPIVLTIPELKSRSTIIMAVLGTALVALLRSKTTRRTMLLLGAIAITYGARHASTVLISWGLGSRATADLSYSDSLRRFAANLAINTITRHPFTGIGYGNFAALAHQSRNIGIPLNTHNDYLRIAAEAGVPATICLFAPVLLALRAAIGDRYRATALPPLIVYLLLLGSTNCLSNLTVSVGFWTLVGTLAVRSGPAVKQVAQNEFHSGNGQTT